MLDKSHQFDPDDKMLDNLGRSPRYTMIDGKGAAFITGDRNRFFVWVPNYNAQMEISYIPNPSLDNTLSLRLRSRHNELDPPENRFGGYRVGN
jgi:hypothetical protein